MLGFLRIWAALLVAPLPAAALAPRHYAGNFGRAARPRSARRPAAAAARQPRLHSVMRRFTKASGHLAAAAQRQHALEPHPDATEPNHNNCSRDEPSFLPAIASIARSFRPQWVSEMKAASAPGTVPIVALISRHLLCVADNFLVHVANASRDSSSEAKTSATPGRQRQQQLALRPVQPVLLASLDRESQQFCLGREQDGVELYCVDMSGLVPNVAGGPAGIVNDNAGFNTCLYTTILWAKPVAILHALHAFPEGVLFLDVDVVVHGNLLRWLQDKQQKHAEQLIAGFEVAADADPRGTPNTGIIFATVKSLPLVEEWLQQAEDPVHLSNALGEQDALFRCKHIRQRVEIVHKKYVGTCGEHGIYATHFNCQEDKILSMTKAGWWRPQASECQKTAHSGTKPI
mmetsp:Transcript_71329/g.127184  ORF Transcript_71329/g.127184 Transcript_71329/m.127184 type:complete len:403 (+) Transcript_71329:72-1280(+)